MREGDMKYLKIAGNEFLFNVVEDPLERANLARAAAGRVQADGAGRLRRRNGTRPCCRIRADVNSGPVGGTLNELADFTPACSGSGKRRLNSGLNVDDRSALPRFLSASSRQSSAIAMVRYVFLRRLVCRPGGGLQFQARVADPLFFNTSESHVPIPFSSFFSTVVGFDTSNPRVLRYILLFLGEVEQQVETGEVGAAVSMTERTCWFSITCISRTASRKASSNRCLVVQKSNFRQFWRALRRSLIGFVQART